MQIVKAGLASVLQERGISMGMEPGIAIFGMHISARVLKPGLMALGLLLGLLQPPAALADTAPATYPGFFTAESVGGLYPTGACAPGMNSKTLEACVTSYITTHGPYFLDTDWQAQDEIPCESPVDSAVECNVAVFAQTGNPSNSSHAYIDMHCTRGGIGSPAVPDGRVYPDFCIVFSLIPDANAGCHCQDHNTAAWTSHPINTSFGNEHETFTDYRGQGPFPLEFTRGYNSLLANQTGSTGAESIGQGWTDNVQNHLYLSQSWPLLLCRETVTPFSYFMCPVSGYSGNLILEAKLWLADGSQAYFNYDTSSPPPDGTPLTPEANTAGQLFFVSTLPVSGGGSGYRYLRDDGYSEYYDSTGKLVSVMDRNGLQQVYSYTNGQLTGITDPANRSLTFTYYTSGTAAGLLETMTDPAGYVYTYTYDGNNNLSTVTHPDKVVAGAVTYATVTYKYEDSSFPNALTGVVDENNNRYMTWGYDNLGRATSSYLGSSTEQFDKFSVVYTADSGGKISSAAITEPNPHGTTSNTRTVNFTTSTNVDQMTSSSGRCAECGDAAASRTYDANGFVQTETDFSTTDIAGNAVTGATSYIHDATGQETSRTEGCTPSGGVVDCTGPDARTITTTWDATRQPKLITEPGRTTQFDYDAVGHVLKKTVTDTATGVARVTGYTYNAFGLLETVTDPLNNVTRYDYESNGDLAAITQDATGLRQKTQITSHDANGMPTTVIDPNNVVTTLTYDGLERLTSRTVDGAETQYLYDSRGLLQQVILPGGSSLSYDYDDAHRLIDVYDNYNDKIVYKLDNLGNRYEEDTDDPSGTLQKTLSRSYNNLNQLIQLGTSGLVYDPASQLDTAQTLNTVYAPDSAGNVTKITDPAGNPTVQGYDVLNRLAGVVDAQTPVKGNTAYKYDPLDRVEHVTDPVGLDTHYIYDAFGDVTEQDSPDTGTTSYSYYLNGNRETKTDARGITATYTYDGLNRLTGIGYLDPSRDVVYTYDQGAYGIGRLYSITDATGTTTYGYDSHGNVTQKTVVMNGHSFVIGYHYDAADNLTEMDYPSGMHVHYNRDAAERVTSVTSDSSTFISGITYEPFGPVTGLTYGNGLVESRTYDQSYQLHQIIASAIENLKFHYDKDGNIVGITDGMNSGNSQVLGYDTVNRLTSASGAYGSQSYDYDLDGNRTQETQDGAATTLSYAYLAPPGGNQLLGVGLQDYQYDVLGNLTNNGTHSYNYDVTDRLQGFDSVSTAYVYNGLGQRSIKFPDIGTDTTPPSVTITAPADGTEVSGTVSVTAAAADNVGVTSVQFKLDGVNLGSPATNAPYSSSWDTTTASQGPHTLTATATDAAGNTTTSTAVIAFIPDTTPPTISITAPANDASVSGTAVILSATAADNIGVASVQFQIDGSSIGSVITSAPYDLSWDSTTSIGAHTLTAIATDTSGNQTTSAPISITVQDIAATANGGSLTTNVNVTGNGTLAAVLAYPTQTLTFAMVTAPSHGTVTITNAATGAFTYTPAADYVGTDSFTFTAMDGYGTVSNIATESVTVSDLTATAVDGSLTTNVNVAGTGTLAATLAYPTQTLTFTAVTAPVHGTLTITNAATGAFTYTPAANYIGADSFTFSATDGYGVVTNVATESITVSDVAATAVAGSLTTSVNVVGAGTLAATLDYPTQALTFAVVTAPVHGAVTITNAATGTFTYTPAVNYIGTDSFTFSATDGYGVATNVATESVTVSDVAATAVAGSLTTNVNVAGSGTLAATLDYPTQTLTFAVITAPVHGSVTITNAATGAFTYTPAANYVGTDSFTFSATDSYGLVSNVATETITDSDVAATAVAGSLTTNVNVAGSGTLAATLDYPTQTLTFAVTTAPVHGTVTITNAATGAFTYTPTANYVGTDSFTFNATDGGGTVSNTAVESVTVSDVAATAVAGSLTTNVNVAGSGTLAATLDYPTQTLTFAVVTAPVHGSVTITNAATGAFTYTPAANYVGTDSFTFSATDGYGLVTNVATETITDSDVAATAVAGSLTTNVNVAGSGTLAATLDYPTQILTYAVVTGPSHGSVNITNASTGAFTYTPATGYAGADSFTFTVTDAYHAISNTAAEGVTVVDVTPPWVNLTGPVSGADLSATYNLTVTAGDDVGVASVQYQVDGANVVPPVTTAPFTYPWDSTSVGNGSHSFTAVAKDAAGNTTTSTAVSANVSNASLSPASFTFADTQAGGTSGAKLFTLTNGGNTQLSVSTPSIGSPNPNQFTVVSGGSCGSALAAHSTCTIAVEFVPSDADSYSATVSVRLGPYVYSSTVSGKGYIVAPTLSPPSHNFGNRSVGAGPSAVFSFTVSNNNNVSIDIYSVATGAPNPNQFIINDPGTGTTCAHSGWLAAHSTCTYGVYFNPSGLGPFNSAIVLKTVGTADVRSTLSGTGVN